MTDTFNPTAYKIEPTPKKKRWFTKPVVLLPVAALIVGVGVGSAGQKAPETIVETKTVTETVTEEVEVTPASCLEALDLNEEAFDYASESLGHIAAGDFAAANRSTERMGTLTPRVNAAKESCRAAAS